MTPIIVDLSGRNEARQQSRHNQPAGSLRIRPVVFLLILKEKVYCGFVVIHISADDRVGNDDTVPADKEGRRISLEREDWVCSSL